MYKWNLCARSRYPASKIKDISKLLSVLSTHSYFYTLNIISRSVKSNAKVQTCNHLIQSVLNLGLQIKLLTHSTPDLSRRHNLHTFFQKLRCEWENIWRKVVHINHLNNVPSNLFQNILSSLADDTVLSRRHHLHTFSQKLRCKWENIWRKVVHIKHLNNIPSSFSQNMFSFDRWFCQKFHPISSLKHLCKSPNLFPQIHSS
jgi:hypothetical protein